MTEDRSEKQNRPLWARGWIVLAAVVIGIGAIGALLPEQDDTADPLASPTTLGNSTTSSPPTTSPAPFTTTTTAFEPVTFSGSGNDTIEFEAPDDLASVLRISHSGEAAFSVTTYGGDAELIELIVDTEGAYEGTRAVNLVMGDLISSIEVVADGEWTITAMYLGALDRNVNEASGSGDTVLIMDITNPAMSIDYEDDTEFSVFMWTFQDQGYLINETGPIDATVAVPIGGVVLEVQATGDWSLSTTR